MQKRYKITIINSAGNRYEVKYLPDNIERITMQIQCNLLDLPLIINRGVSVDTLRFVKEDFQYLHKVFSEKNWNNCKLEISYNENTQTFGIDFAKYKWTVAYCEVGLKFSELQNLVDTLEDVTVTNVTQAVNIANNTVPMIARCGMLFQDWQIKWKYNAVTPSNYGCFFANSSEQESVPHQFTQPVSEISNLFLVLAPPYPTPLDGGTDSKYNAHGEIESIFSWKVRNSNIVTTKLFVFNAVSKFDIYPTMNTPTAKVSYLIFMEYKDLSGVWHIAPGHTVTGFAGSQDIHYYNSESMFAVGGWKQITTSQWMPTQYPFDGSAGLAYPACTEAIVHFCIAPMQIWNWHATSNYSDVNTTGRLIIKNAQLHFNYGISGIFNLVSVKKVLNISGLFDVSNMIDKYFLTTSKKTLKISDLLKQLTAVFGFIFYENNGKYEVMQTWPNFPTEIIQKADIYDISYESVQNYAKIKYLQNSNIINPKPATADVLDYSTEILTDLFEIMQSLNTGGEDVIFSVANNQLEDVTPTVWLNFHRFILNYIENNVTNFNPLFENYIVKCKIKSNNFTFFNFATLKNIQINDKKAFILNSESSDNLDTFDVTAIFYR